MKSKWYEKLYLVLLVIFFYAPIVYVIVFSFNSSKSLSSFSGFSLMWYEKMFKSKTIMQSVYYTVVVAVCATFISTIIGTISAIGLSKQNKIIKEIVTQVNNLPMLNPDIVTAIGLLLFFTTLGIKKGFGTLLLAHVIFCIPYVMITVTPRLRQLDDNTIEAALDLGCTPLQAITKVIVPQIFPAIVSGAIVAFTMSFDDFVISYFTTGAGIDNISTFVYSSTKRINPSVNALSTFIIVIVLIVMVVVNTIPIILAKRRVSK